MQTHIRTHTYTHTHTHTHTKARGKGSNVHVLTKIVCIFSFRSPPLSPLLLSVTFKHSLPLQISPSTSPRCHCLTTLPHSFFSSFLAFLPCSPSFLSLKHYLLLKVPCCLKYLVMVCSCSTSALNENVLFVMCLMKERFSSVHVWLQF